MRSKAHIRKKEKRQAIRDEWFSLYLLDQDKKTPAVRKRMRVLYRQFMEVR